jgi:hypothetical protein
MAGACPSAATVPRPPAAVFVLSATRALQAAMTLSGHCCLSILVYQDSLQNITEM